MWLGTATTPLHGRDCSVCCNDTVATHECKRLKTLNTQLGCTQSMAQACEATQRRAITKRQNHGAGLAVSRQR